MNTPPPGQTPRDCCSAHSKPMAPQATPHIHGDHAHAAHAPVGADAEAVIYTCPMHPQIRQKGPGHCPICGMALEPLVPKVVEDDSDVRAVRRKFWIAVALAAPVVVLGMAPHLLDLSLTHAQAKLLQYVELALTAPV